MAKQSTNRAGVSAPAPVEPKSKISSETGIKLAKERQYKLAQRAGRAGASDDEIEKYQRLLGSENLTTDTVDEIEGQIAELESARDKACRVYYVADGARVFWRGENCGPGTKLRLTEAEAGDMGAMVSTKGPRKAQPKPEQRKAGNYRVRGPGSVKFGGRFHRPESILYLDSPDAISLGDAIEFVHPDEGE